MIRNLVLLLTILALIFIAANQNPPSRMVEVAYCVVDVRAAGKNPLTGEYEYGWAKMYRPCSEQDIFRQI